MKTSTTQEQGLFVLLLIFIIQENISLPSCSIKMCLSCTLEPDILNLTCKIDKLHLPVSIHNNFGKEIAFCSLPFPSPLCISGNKNTTVRQNIHTNETVVTIREIIDQRINGNWSCLHGYGRDMYEADLEINIPILEGQHKREQTGDLLSPKEISWYNKAGISISVITLTIVGGVLGIWIYNRKCSFGSVKNVSAQNEPQVENGSAQNKPQVENGSAQNKPQVENGSAQNDPQVENGSAQNKPQVENGSAQNKPQVENVSAQNEPQADDKSNQEEEKKPLLQNEETQNNGQCLQTGGTDNTGAESREDALETETKI